MGPERGKRELDGHVMGCIMYSDIFKQHESLSPKCNEFH